MFGRKEPKKNSNDNAEDEIHRGHQARSRGALITHCWCIASARLSNWPAMRLTGIPEARASAIALSIALENSAAEFFGLFVIALHFSNKATKAKPAANVTPSAVGLDINNNGGTTIETSIPTNLLKQVFKHLEQGNA